MTYQKAHEIAMKAIKIANDYGHEFRPGAHCAVADAILAAPKSSQIDAATQALESQKLK